MKKIVWLILSLLPVINTVAKVKLPALLGDHMVLQQSSSVNLWGWAAPSRNVVVKPSWNGQSYTTKAGTDGKWLVQVQTPAAGGPYRIEISDGTPVILNDVLIGEVWVCSGQSNMEMPVHGFFGQSVTGSTDEIMEANQYPDIRLFTVHRAPAPTPKDDCEGSWQKSTMKSVRDFSATAYFFGKNLNKALNIPVGLITSNWGGTVIESWMTEESIREIPDINLDIALKPDNNADEAKPSWLFNGMIAPLVHYTSKGFIWYQGESNRRNYFDYGKLMGAMVKLWRSSWKNMDMPFYYVQLAPYEYDGAEKTSLPLTIEAQYKALQYIPNAAIAPSSDLGHRTCIHPPQKKEVGQRLAFLALSHTYGMEGLPPDAPVIDMVTYEGSKAILTFKTTSDAVALGSFDYYTGEIKGFEMAGEDRKFYPAKANHIWWQDNKIEVICDRVPKPVAIRYAFRNWHEANVKTTDGLPLVPFRTDNWDDVY